MSMTERSVLRVRERPHNDPERAGETIVEVVRDGEVVAFIYGSREGLQIVSERCVDDFTNLPFRFVAGPTPSLVVPLLKPDEDCPWCDGSRMVLGQVCPVCRIEIAQ